jgi:DNA replication protein DnaC
MRDDEPIDVDEVRRTATAYDETARAEREREDRVRIWSGVVAREVAEALYDRAETSTEALKHVRGFLASSRPCLILCGGVGTGKTVAALAAHRDAPRGVFLKASELARSVDPWKHEIEQGWKPIDIDIPQIVIDDLGAEMDEPRFHQALFAVVDARQSPATRTIITTNLKREEIRPRYKDRIADRLNAMSKAVQLKGTSMRKQEAGL